jgi:integrase
MKPGTVRAHLNSLSNLYRRAQAESVVPPGFNPVAGMMDKPQPDAGEADWFEVHDAALILEGARRFRPSTVAVQLGPVHSDVVHPLIACSLLTGGRKDEVLGLLAQDVSFDRKTVSFRPNRFRRLKTRNAPRTVPLFPQLEEILREYVFGRSAPLADDGLLFPSARTGGKISDVDKALDRVSEMAGFEKGELRLKKFRHTFCAARLQTLDNGAPISPFTVGRELGHGGTSLVERVYGHLGTVRHRSEHLEYRIENHTEELAERLKVLGW